MPLLPLKSRSLPGERTGRLFHTREMGLAAVGLVAVIVTAGMAGESSPPGKNGWERSLSGSFSTQGGNTNLSSYALALTADYAGDIRRGGLELSDTEIHLAVNHKRGILNGSLYEEDGSATFLLDVKAHGRFSPFFLSFWTYDSTTNLDNRTQLGAGGKYTFGRGFSVSLAYLWESERYRGRTRTLQYRWSLRPKYKITLSSGVSFITMVFLQPLVTDPGRFLIDSRLNLILPTLVRVLGGDNMLNVTMGWREQYNSHPPGGIRKRDSDLNMGLMMTF